LASDCGQHIQSVTLIEHKGYKGHKGKTYLPNMHSLEPVSKGVAQGFSPAFAALKGCATGWFCNVLFVSFVSFVLTPRV
jgi:hypothetical protein